MKKLIPLTFLTLFIGLSAISQKISSSKVPVAVNTAFQKQYPNAVVKWEKEKGNYEAGFKEGNHKVSVVYDAQGKLLETETDISQNELPPNALQYLKTNHAGKKITEAAKITKADGTVLYEAEVGGADMIFDAKGKFLKVEKDHE